MVHWEQLSEGVLACEREREGESGEKGERESTRGVRERERGERERSQMDIETEELM